MCWCAETWSQANSVRKRPGLPMGSWHRSWGPSAVGTGLYCPWYLPSMSVPTCHLPFRHGHPGSKGTSTSLRMSRGGWSGRWQAYTGTDLRGRAGRAQYGDPGEKGSGLTTSPQDTSWRGWRGQQNIVWAPRPEPAQNQNSRMGAATEQSPSQAWVKKALFQPASCDWVEQSTWTHEEHKITELIQVFSSKWIVQETTAYWLQGRTIQCHNQWRNLHGCPEGPTKITEYKHKLQALK